MLIIVEIKKLRYIALKGNIVAYIFSREAQCFVEIARKMIAEILQCRQGVTVREDAYRIANYYSRHAYTIATTEIYAFVSYQEGAARNCVYMPELIRSSLRHPGLTLATVRGH